MHRLAPLLGLFAALSLGACTEYDLGRDEDPPPDKDDDTGGETDLPEDSDPPQDSDPPDDSDPPIDETGDPVVAVDPMYAHTSSQLFSVEPQNPYGHSLIGTFADPSSGPVTDITDIAIDTDGIMYAVSFDTLYRVNASNAQLETMGLAGPAAMNALTFLADGTLLAGDGSDLYEVDTNTGAFTQASSIGDWSFAGDMVGLPDGLLYCAMSNDSTGDQSALVVYDMSSGTIIHTGNTGTGSLYGVAYAEERLFGFNGDGEIFELDQSDGRATRIRDTEEAWWGATTNPVTW